MFMFTIKACDWRKFHESLPPLSPAQTDAQFSAAIAANLLATLKTLAAERNRESKKKDFPDYFLDFGLEYLMDERIVAYKYDFVK